MKKFIPTLLVVALACSSSSAYAAATASNGDSRALLEQARARFGKGELGKTRELLKRAGVSTKDGQLLGQIHLLAGLAWASENRSQRAKAAFRRALGHNPSLELDAKRYKPAFVTLFEQVRRATVGKLEVDANGATSTLMIDGREVGKTPYSGFLLSGLHQLVLVSSSGTQQRSSVTIEAGKITRLLLQAGPTSMVAAKPRKTPAEPPRRGKEGRSRLWTWVAAGAAVAGAGLAIGLGLAAKADQDEACGLLAGGGACDGRSALVDPSQRERYEALNARMDDKALASTIAWAGAGALAVTAVVLFFFEDGANAERGAQISMSARDISLRFAF